MTALDDEWLIEQLHKYFIDDDTTDFTVLDFVHAFGSPSIALMYARLFAPSFIVIDNMVFLREQLEDGEALENLARFRAENPGDPAAVERSFNWVEIARIFGRRPSETQWQRVLGGLLADFWRWRLHVEFPDRNFVVSILEPTENDELSVVFYQSSAADLPPQMMVRPRRPLCPVR